MLNQLPHLCYTILSNEDILHSLALKVSYRYQYATQHDAQWLLKYNLEFAIQTPQTHESYETIAIILQTHTPLQILPIILKHCNGVKKIYIKYLDKKDIYFETLFYEWCQQMPAIKDYLIIADDMPKHCDKYFLYPNNNFNVLLWRNYFQNKKLDIIKYIPKAVIINDNTTDSQLKMLIKILHTNCNLSVFKIDQLIMPSFYSFDAIVNLCKTYFLTDGLPAYKQQYDYQLTRLLLQKKSFVQTPNFLFVKDDYPFANVAEINYTHNPHPEAKTVALNDVDDEKDFLELLIC